MKEWWFKLFAPPVACRLCARPVRVPPWVPAFRRICAGCREGIVPIQGDLCACCGRMRDPGSRPLCDDCLRVEETRRVTCRSAVAYGGQIGEWIALLKYRGKESLAGFMGEWMAEVVREHYGEHSIDWISFVPLHPWRLSERRFNQAELLAGAISRKLGIPMAALLVRGRPTAQQSRKNRKERLVSLQGAFRLSPESAGLALTGKTVLLVDDVYTTGTTLRECAEPLRRAGAGRILAVTFAR